MRFYLASSYANQIQMQKYARQLRALGYEVTSRWIYGHAIPDSAANPDALKQRFAREDQTDLYECSHVLNFTGVKIGRGGRHVEFGIGLEMNKTMIIIGPKENVFHSLREVEQYPDWESFLEELTNGHKLSDGIVKRHSESRGPSPRGDLP